MYFDVADTCKDVVLFHLPGVLDCVPNFQFKNVDDTQLGKYIYVWLLYMQLTEVQFWLITLNFLSLVAMIV